MSEPHPVATPATLGPLRRFTGPNASVWKYDLLTALSMHALGQGAGLQTTMLRLIAVVTARYDWRRDELSIGRVELARLWQCSEPTVKREMRRIRELGLLVQIRPGLRGRVAAYRLCRRAIEDLTGGCWEHAGPEFSRRMAVPVAPSGNVVGFPQQTAQDGPSNLPDWASIVTGGDTAVYRNWFSQVTLRRDGQVAVFRAPSDFVASQIETRFRHRMQEAVQYLWPEIRHIRIEAR